MLARLMAAMAAGDQAALFPFIDEFGDRLAGTVQSVLASLHRQDVGRDRQDLDYLVQSAAFVIFERSAGWDPTGALPWTWANRAIRAEVVSWLGHPSAELNDSDIDLRQAYAATAGAGADVDFDELAADHPLIRVLVQAVRTIASPRDADVHFQYQAQKSLRDPSPAHTVGAMFDLTPANVRKIDQRVRGRLSALVVNDPEFAALVRVAWVEAC